MTQGYNGGPPPGYGPPPGQQGYAPPQQQGYAPPQYQQQPQQGYAPPQQPGYGPPPAQQGYPPQQGGYPPPQQGYAPQSSPMGRSVGRSAFSGAMLEGVKPSGNRNPFLELGTHMLIIESTGVTDESGSFVVEAKCHWSDNPIMRVGAVYAWIQSTKDLKVALPSIKRFLIATLGCITEEQCFAAGHNMMQLADAASNTQIALPGNKYPANPLHGYAVMCLVQPSEQDMIAEAQARGAAPPQIRDQRKGPSPFRRCNFTPVQR